MDIERYVQQLTERALGVAEGQDQVPSGPAPSPTRFDLPPVSDTQAEEAIQQAAIGILNSAGVRPFYLNGHLTIGLWPEADRPELREAIQLLHGSHVQLLHLTDPQVPEKYRLGPAQMRAPVDAQGMPWAEWKADMLNRLWKELTGRPARITAKTVAHGQRRKWK